MGADFDADIENIEDTSGIENGLEIDADDSIELGEHQNDDDNSDDENQDENTDDDSDDVIVTIGDEPPVVDEHAKAPAWVRDLRKANREKDKKIRELQAKIDSANPANNQKSIELGPEPTLESCDYDAEVFKSELVAWIDKKRKFDDAVADNQRKTEENQRQAQAAIEGYNKSKSALKVKDFDEAESLIEDTFSATQQGIVVHGADNPALVVYALGKNPKKAKELAAINDPVKFAFAVAKLEKELKVTNRKSAPPPERSISSSGRVSGTVDSTLDRLRAAAEKTGDYSKVIQYKRQKKAA